MPGMIIKIPTRIQHNIPKICFFTGIISQRLTPVTPGVKVLLQHLDSSGVDLARVQLILQIGNVAMFSTTRMLSRASTGT